MEFLQAHEKNFRVKRKQPIKFIVIHYTANNGDTAMGNARYFARENVGASAHYFVDENEVVQSVKDSDVAFHCGSDTGKYVHPTCRNDNAIGIELCSRKDVYGGFYFRPKTISNTIALVQQLMEQYNIDSAHVVRHYDVTGKRCPAPFVDNQSAWLDFKKEINTVKMTQDEFDSMMQEYLNKQAIKPADKYSQDARNWAEREGLIQGDDRGQKMYKSPCTREHMVIFLYRFWKILEKYFKK